MWIHSLISIENNVRRNGLWTLRKSRQWSIRGIWNKGRGINLDKKTATAEISKKITDEAIKGAIEEVGYDVLTIK